MGCCRRSGCMGVWAVIEQVFSDNTAWHGTADRNASHLLRRDMTQENEQAKSRNRSVTVQVPHWVLFVLTGGKSPFGLSDTGARN